jgi:hypothetical protein
MDEKVEEEGSKKETLGSTLNKSSELGSFFIARDLE